MLRAGSGRLAGRLTAMKQRMKPPLRQRNGESNTMEARRHACNRIHHAVEQHEGSDGLMTPVEVRLRRRVVLCAFSYPPKADECARALSPPWASATAETSARATCVHRSRLFGLGALASLSRSHR